MTADFEKLGKRAVSCKHWRWLDGVHVFSPAEHTGDTGCTYRMPQDGHVLWRDYPDLTDPATLGCLLALVRQAWANPRLHAVTDNEGSFVDPADGPHWRVFATNHCFEGNTEAEALVAALEGAP